MSRTILLSELVRKEGSIAGAHRWLTRHGLGVQYPTLWGWINGKTAVSHAYVSLLKGIGVVIG